LEHQQFIHTITLILIGSFLPPPRLNTISPLDGGRELNPSLAAIALTQFWIWSGRKIP